MDRNWRWGWKWSQWSWWNEKANVIFHGTGWCPNDPIRPKKEGEECTVPTDCYHNMDGSGGNCCDGKCVKADKMLWTGPHFTSVPVWDEDFEGDVSPEDMTGTGWCPNDPIRPKKEGEECSRPTDCYHNMNGTGGNCCDGVCVKAEEMLWTGPHFTSVPVWDEDFEGDVSEDDMTGIGWCPNDPIRPKKEGEECSRPTDCYHNMNGTVIVAGKC